MVRVDDHVLVVVQAFSVLQTNFASHLQHALQPSNHFFFPLPLPFNTLYHIFKTLAVELIKLHFIELRHFIEQLLVNCHFVEKRQLLACVDQILYPVHSLLVGLLMFLTKEELDQSQEHIVEVVLLYCKVGWDH